MIVSTDQSPDEELQSRQPPVRRPSAPTLRCTLVLLCPIIAAGLIYQEIQAYIERRAPVTIYAIPVYPSAQDVCYAVGSKPDNCATLYFGTVDSAERVQSFYENALQGRGWLGDGSVYPEYNPINRYREFRGGMQVLSIQLTPVDLMTHIEIQLCKTD
jgi:hypothetical protein